MYRKLGILIVMLIVAQLKVGETKGQSSILGIVEECQVGFIASTIEWSNDDEYILCIGTDSGALLIDTSTYAVHSVYPHQAILNATFNQVNTQIMTWGQDGYVRVWEIGNSTPLLELYDGGFFPVPKWNHDESLIASSDPSFGGTRIWDATTGVLLLETDMGSGVETYQGTINAWHPTQNLLLTSHQAQTELWDIEQQTVLAEWEGQSRSSPFPTWNISGDLIAVWDDPLIIVDKTLQEVNRFDMRVSWGIWGSQGLLLLRTQDRGFVWNPYSNDVLLEIEDIDLGTALLWHPDGNKFAFWRGNDTFQIWAIEGPIVSFQNDSLPTEAFGNHGRWSYDGHYFIYFTLDRQVIIFNALTGEKLFEVQHPLIYEFESEDVHIGGMLSHKGDRIATCTPYHLLIQQIQ